MRFCLTASSRFCCWRSPADRSPGLPMATGRYARPFRSESVSVVWALRCALPSREMGTPCSWARRGASTSASLLFPFLSSSVAARPWLLSRRAPVDPRRSADHASSPGGRFVRLGRRAVRERSGCIGRGSGYRLSRGPRLWRSLCVRTHGHEGLASEKNGAGYCGQLSGMVGCPLGQRAMGIGGRPVGQHHVCAPETREPVDTERAHYRTHLRYRRLFRFRGSPLRDGDIGPDRSRLCRRVSRYQPY